LLLNTDKQTTASDATYCVLSNLSAVPTLSRWLTCFPVPLRPIAFVIY